MTGNCIICNKKLKPGQRSDTLYCSGKCRSKAHNQRKANLKRLQAHQFDMFEQKDLQTVATVSEVAAAFVAKCAVTVNREFGREALDAMWELAARCGCDFSARAAEQESR